MDISQTQERFDIPCVILAGGKSSRMGSDKALLPFGTFNSLAEFQYTKLGGFFKKVYISSKVNKFKFLHNQILDKEDLASAMIALKNILTFLQAEKVFIIAVDYPFVQKSTIQTLINNANEAEIILPKTEKTHNLCGIYSLDTIKKIEFLLSTNTHKISDLTTLCRTMMIQFDETQEFSNLNFPQDYDFAHNLIKNNFYL